MKTTLRTLIAVLLLANVAHAQRPLTIVVDESRESRNLVSEWNRNWPLGCLRTEIEAGCDVKFVPHYEAHERAPYPVVVIGNQRPFRVRACASGEALRNLHAELMRDDAAYEHARTSHQDSWNVMGVAWREGWWNEDGTPANGPPDDEPVVAKKPNQE